MRKKELVRLNMLARMGAFQGSPIYLNARQINRLNQARINAASTLMFESIGGKDIKYQDILIKGGHHDYFDDYSRKEVRLNDGIGQRVTQGFLVHIFQKLPKFTKDDEVQTEYIMPATRAALKTLNLKPKFIEIGTNCVTNGWSLVNWQPQIMGEQITGLGCKVFGYEECHPRNWIRFSHPERVNLISHYRAIYIPKPLGVEGQSQTLHQERYTLRPDDPTFQHLARIDRNYGYGYSRIQPIWDAITKLRERSDSDHFLKSNFMEARYPSAWKATKKARAFIDKVRKATRRRGIAIEAVTDPTTNADTGLPSVQYRPWGQGPQGQKMDTNQASAYLDGEWLRLLVNLGYSQIWATGGNAGALEGSEINLTKDDRADIAEFSILSPIFKDILKRLAELGIMQAVGVPEEEISLLLSKDYEMIPWLTWEFNDKAALQQEQLEHQMEMEKGQSEGRNKYDKSNENRENAITRYNNAVQDLLIHSIQNQMAMPMTPVMSSWLRRVGYEDNLMFMETHEGYKYQKPVGDAQSQYFSWVDSGSKGGYYWDNFADRDPPWQRIPNFPSNLDAGYGEGALGTPEQSREYKMEGGGVVEGAGTTREPFGLKIPSTTTTGGSGQATTGYTPPMSYGEQSYTTDWSDTRESPYPVYRSPYNQKFTKILNSASALRRYAKDISTDHLPEGWSMRQDTPYKISELLNEIIKDSYRINRVSFGNSVKAGHPYNYGGDDEFICPKEYRKNIGKKVPLGIYHNRDTPGSVDLPEWQIIGTHEVIGWDDTLGQEIAKNEYDEKKINEFFEKIGEENWIQPYLDAGEEPPISGAYTCNIVKYNNKNYQVNIDLKSMSFVPDANCPWDICNFKPQAEASET